MATTQIFGNQIQDLTITSSDLASGAVTPAKISAVATDDFSFPRDVTATRNLKVTDDNKLVLDTAGNVHWRYNSDADILMGAWYTGGELDFGAASEVNLYSNTNNDGSGSYDPRISLKPVGEVEIRNVDQGTDTDRKLTIHFQNGVGSGDHTIMQLKRNGTDLFMNMGYKANGSSITASTLRSGLSVPLVLETSSTPDAVTISDNGNVGVGGVAVTNGLLTLTSTSAAFVPPRMTTTQRDAITPLTAGMTIYNTTDNQLNVYDGTDWVPVGSTEFPLLAPDGTEAAPSYSFENYTGTGFSADGSLVLSVNGNATVYFEATVMSVQTNILLDDNGTAGDPTLMWSSSGNQGFYAPASGEISYSNGSSEIFRFTSDGIDFLQNEAKQLVVHILASDPGSPVEGQIWYNTTTKQWAGYNGTTNVVLG